MNNGDRHIGLEELRRRAFSVPTMVGLLIGILIIGLVLRQFLDFDWDDFASNISRLNLRLYALAARLLLPQLLVPRHQMALHYTNRNIQVRRRFSDDPRIPDTRGAHTRGMVLELGDVLETR